MKNLQYAAPIQFERKKQTLKRYPVCESTLYKKIAAGIWPTPINLGGGRAVAFIEAETTAMINAISAGATIEELKELVQTLITKREEYKI